MNNDRHFNPDIEAGEYYYYRVATKDHSEFLGLWVLIRENAKNNKATPLEKVVRFYSLLEMVLGAKQQFYFSRQRDYINKVIAHFEKEEGYIFHINIPAFNEDEGEMDSIDFGFSSMIAGIIHTLIELEKERKKNFSCKECVVQAIIGLLEYRQSVMNKKQKEDYTIYRTAAVARCIADKVFGYHIKVVKNINQEYFQKSRYAIIDARKRRPELFADIK